MAKSRHRPHTQHGWQNRIVDCGTQAADQFVAHPDNWRIHPHEQEIALLQVMDRIGWVQEVIVSKRTGYLLDGHLRVKAALARGDDTPVPYKVVDVTEHEEALLLATYDPMGALAVSDRAKLDEVIALLPEEDAALATLLHGERKRLKALVADEAQHHEDGHFVIVVECENEAQQTALLAQWLKRGLRCKAMLA